MFVEHIKKRYSDKEHVQVLLRETYRERAQGKSKVKHRTLLNLTHYPKEIQQAIAVAVSAPRRVVDMMECPAANEMTVGETRSIGAVWCVARVAQHLGITEALGRGRQAQLALWQIIARVVDQGSRLSAVRLQQRHALAEVIGLEQGLDEDDLYDNLTWLCERQSAIEQRLFRQRHGEHPPRMLLYDVTSSYLEGQQNAFGAFGYSRDKKKGKKQIVVGLLCDHLGSPLSVQVFKGNTQDPKTMQPQIEKALEQFGCDTVTFVGDRGMIKNAQMDALNALNYHFITALTKPQITGLIKQEALQLDMFEERLCEVSYDGRRLILRRNPVRAQEMAQSRADKQRCVETFVAQRNAYLREHPRASMEVALKEAQKKIDKLKIGQWFHVVARERTLISSIDRNALNEASRLDGCYVIVTDLKHKQADAQLVHERYRDLARVEKGFRVSKTGHLELRPIYVQTKEHTCGHVFVVMMSYMIRRELERAWQEFDMTVEEGLDMLSSVAVAPITLSPTCTIEKITTPAEQSQNLLQVLNIELPPAIPKSDVRVATKKKLPQRRIRQ